MKQDCKMLIIGTRWSIHDPIDRLAQRCFDGQKSKFVKLPALDLHGNSNFNYDHGVGFSTDYFLNLKENMDAISWRAIYMQEPVEREGLLYTEDDPQYFFELPKERPDAIIAVCDSKGQRETISERVRDNMLFFSKTGRWLGGPDPTGFACIKK